ncbi:MAG: tetratricopeptide repeat protein [Alphaproteobacteria bacterium]|nr:tetratricopeptide repeat protein [Alphaproteobacteria bacterium]
MPDEGAELQQNGGNDSAEKPSLVHPDSRYHDAVAALQAGKLQEAEQAVKAVLRDNERDAQAIHLLGVVAHQAQKTDVGIQLIQKALEIEPNSAAFLNTLGFLFRQERRYPDAVSALRRAVELRPTYSEAYNNLGIALSESGQSDAAIEAYETALKTQSVFPEVLNNLGNVLARGNRLDEAIARSDEAIAIREDYAEAWSNKGDALFARGKVKGSADRTTAMACYERAVEINPRAVESWVKLGTSRHSEEKFVEAEVAFRKALRLSPNHVRALTTYAVTLEKLGRLTSAASHLRHVLTIAPDDVGALKSLGHVTLKLGNSVEAKHVLARARELAPADPDVLYSYANCLLRMEQLQPAMDLYLRVRELQPNQARGTFAPAAVLLMDGQYEKGWAAYESRYAMSAFKPNVPNIRERLWDGSPLNGRTLLVHVEQGFGDTIQFCRYVPMLRQRLGTGGKIIFLCEKEVYRLMGTLDGVDELYHLRQENAEIVFDVQIPLLSLPHRFGTTLETVPRNIPYLSVPESAMREASLPKSKDGVIKAGIVWTGRPTHSDNLYRSMPLKEFANLFGINGVDFHSLQIGNGVADLQPYLKRGNVFDHSSDIKDFADTAAILKELDVLISVDTAVCHLAGAMGKDVWTMLPFGGEWRWLRNREDTPWYPTMRLVRQRILSDWGIVLDRVQEGLEGAVKAARSKSLAEGQENTPPETMPAPITDKPLKKAKSKKAAAKK